MNRRLASSLVLALGMSVTGTSHAASPFDGFYLGAQVGYSVYDTKLTASDPTGSATLEGLSGNGVDGGVYGGWGMLFGPAWYGGLEAEYNWSGAEFSATASDATGSGEAKIEDKDNWGVSARLGWLPSNNVMLYGRLGWQRVSLDYSASGNAPSVGLSGAGTISQDHDGFRLGVGTEVAVAPNLLMRLDYNHTWYSKDTVAPGLESEPDNDLFRVGLAYRF